jgi:hypothetical protein
MRSLILFISLMALGWALGCSDRKPTQANISDLKARLEAATALRDPFQKDVALAKVAEHAATVGDAEVTAKAVAGIGDPFKRDGTASNCAPRLAAAGRLHEGVELAKTIGDTFMRDNVLALLAKGNSGR